MKKTLSIVMSLVILMCFAGCSDNTVGTSKSESETPATSAAPTTTEAPSNVYVYDNEAVSITDVCEFYIESSQLTAEVKPANPGSYYNVYESETGQTYVDVIVAYKNLESVGVRPDKAIPGASLVYDDIYKYSGFIAIEEDNRSDFAMFIRNSEIAPLTTGYIHMIFQVPQEVADSSSSIVVHFAVNNTKYSYTVR